MRRGSFAATLVLPWPSRAAAPFIAASALVHVVYFLLVGRLYRNADLSVAYPIVRGLAPLIAAVIAFATLGEAPGPVAGIGIARPGQRRHSDGRKRPRARAGRFGDRCGRARQFVRHRGLFGDRREGGQVAGPSALFAFAYNAWADALTAIAYAPIVIVLRGRAAPIAFVRVWRSGLAGGLAAFVATPSWSGR